MPPPGEEGPEPRCWELPAHRPLALQPWQWALRRSGLCPLPAAQACLPPPPPPPAELASCSRSSCSQ